MIRLFAASVLTLTATSSAEDGPHAHTWNAADASASPRCEAAVAEEEQVGLTPDVSLLQTEWTVMAVDGGARISAAGGGTTGTGLELHTKGESHGQEALKSSAVQITGDHPDSAEHRAVHLEPWGSLTELPSAAMAVAAGPAETRPNMHSSTAGPNSALGDQPLLVLPSVDAAQVGERKMQGEDTLRPDLSARVFYTGAAGGLIIVLLAIFLVVPILCLWQFSKTFDTTGNDPSQQTYPSRPLTRGSAENLLDRRTSATSAHKSSPPSYLRYDHQSQHGTPRATVDSTLGPSSMRLPPTSGAALESVGPSGPPPICPSLILPNTEARFMINIEDLRNPAGSIDIFGTSGRKLLHADITQLADGRRSLSLCSVGCEEDPRCTITTPASVLPTSALEIYGRGRRPYGTLEPGGPGGVMHVGGKPMMVVESAPWPSGNLHTFRMTAATMEGRLLAAADPTNDGRGHGEQSWKLQVKVTPGSDAVLISSCMLALLILWPSAATASQDARAVGPSPRGSELLAPSPHSGGQPHGSRI